MRDRAVVRRRVSTLLWLVFFVFIILLISTLTAATLWRFMTVIGIVPFSEYSPLAFTLLLSLIIGTILTLLTGNYILRPLQKLKEGTQEIANGNFDVQVNITGPQEMEELAASFNEMARELSSIETLRADFVSTISHEFKTPVASIQGFARNLLKYKLTEEKQREYLQIIFSESERLSRLSGNVLLLSNLESKGRVIERQEYSLDEQLRRAVLLLEPQLHKKRLTVDIHLVETIINADEEILNHLWLNLLGNAIKFSPVGGVICVTLDTDEGTASVAIADQGAGMTSEVKARIFEKFYQGDSSRATEGNGLGLSLVKRILELEDGKISIESTPNVGTCFTVTLQRIISTDV
ncbi:MAG: HAMP domain-containing histidine kinase [Defluviitaleaceae bacterium]|nr:HAMP domain-containing histidine kinase [Defluviitaleaceae bacterium]